MASSSGFINVDVDCFIVDAQTTYLSALHSNTVYCVHTPNFDMIRIQTDGSLPYYFEVRCYYTTRASFKKGPPLHTRAVCSKSVKRDDVSASEPTQPGYLTLTS